MILHNVTVIGNPIDGLCRERTERFWRKRVITTIGAERILKRERRMVDGESVTRVETMIDER